MNTETSRRTIVSALSAALALAATPALAHDASPVASPESVSLPDTAAGRQLAWILDLVNGHAPLPDISTVEEHFSPVLLSVIPAAVLLQTLEELRAGFAPVELVEVLEPQTELNLGAVVLVADGSRIVVTINVEAEAPNLIDGLLFSPYEQPAIELPVLADWGDLESALTTEGGAFAISASHIDADEYVPIHQANADAPFAIGSLFKLYVLAALAQEIEAERITWADKIEVTEALLSYPSGVTQDEPPGTLLDVETLAMRMISISDNTATDLLMHRLGRETVEAALTELGQTTAELNRPFLTTREMFIVKLGDHGLRDEFIAADEAERRTVLERLANEPLPPLSAVATQTAPTEIDTIEWFATMRDLERAHVWLRDAWQRPGLEPLKAIMTANPGVPFDGDTWRLASFKGGSEPGVIALAWLLERNDGNVFTLAVAVNNSEQLLDETAIALAAGGAFGLMAKS
jgi:hypothetical protein